MVLILACGGFAWAGETVPSATLWGSHSLNKVARTASPDSDRPSPVLMAGARGEIVSGQAVFRSTADLPDVTVSISDLRHRDSGVTISAAAISLQWVRYIDVDRNTSGIPDDELVAKAPTAIADPFWEGRTIPVEAGQSQPVWIEARVPRRAQAGDYKGRLAVGSRQGKIELPVVLHVWDFEMPQDRHLSVINWWSFPGKGYQGRVESESPEYWELLGRFCTFLAEHRQTAVNASIGLIRRAGNETDTARYDTSQLERYAEVAFAAGIRRIHLHAVGQRTGGITDPRSRVTPRDADFRRLAALEKTIRRRGWQDRFLVAICDEPFVHHEESYAKVVERVHQVAPSVRCVEAVETEYLGKLDVYVPKLSHLNLWYPRFDRLRREGAEIWFYTCCHPVGRYPNRFLDQSLLKVRVLHWLNYLYDLKGYLHWGLNHYGTDAPYTQEGISKGLPLGDRAIVYPGKDGLLGSLRFSAQRDGLQDYEYLWMLEHRLQKIKQRIGKDALWLDPGQRSLELCRRVTWSFCGYTRDPNVLLDTRRTIAEEIESLGTDPLLVVQTSPAEGTPIPAGPRHVIVRGLASPGASVLLDGQPVPNVRPSGYFYHYRFLSDKPTITIAVKHQGKMRTVTRTFRLVD